MITAVMKTCSDSSLAGILSIVKNVMLIIQVVVPIMLIVWAALELVKLTMNPEAKNGNKKIINKFVAAAIIFFIPVLINVTMGLLGEKTNISKCWTNAKKINPNTTYTSPTDDGPKTQKPIDLKKYEK